MNISALLSVTAGIDGAYKAMCQPVLKEFHIRQVPFDILMCLKNNPNTYTATQISSLRHLRPSVVSHYVDILVQNGLLERDTVDGDRRKVKLRLTTLAEPIVIRGHEMQLSFYHEITRGLSFDELETFRRCVKVAGQNADEIRMAHRNDREAGAC